MTEYLILRGTGYDPIIVPYDAVFALIKRLDDLIDKDISPEVNKEAMTVLKAVTASLVYPVKEGGGVSGSPQNQRFCGEKEHPRNREAFGACDKSERMERDATWQPQDSGPSKAG